MPPKKRSEDQIQDFLNLAQDRFKLAAEAESETRLAALDDLQFSVGDQWPPDIKADRQLSGRPCLTVNVLPQFIRQVTNEQRQQRPSIAVNPVGNEADIDTAEILQGMTRHIEVRSDAEVAYDYATDYMVRCGFGFWELLNEYANGQDGPQEIAIKLIRNPFTVYIDPNAQELDRSDARWAFKVVDVSVNEFRARYPESKLSLGASLDDYMSVGDDPATWGSKSGPLPTIRIAEYWYFEDDKAKEMSWSLITARDILDDEKTIWDSVPLVGVYGDDLVVNGRSYQAGLVRFAKDPQRAKNYWTSAATEMIALAPKAPYIGAVGQFKSKQAQWEQANYRNFSYLEYDPVAAGGSAAPPPERNAVEPPIQAMNQMLALATLDLQATTGLNDANLGQTRRPDESGKAVLARQKQGDIATLNYSDNVARGGRRTGRMLVKAIPKVYTEARVQRIIKPDGTVQKVGIFNSQNQDAQEAHAQIAAIDPAIEKIYDVGVGDYDVTVSVGPSYQTKRQEAVATQMALIQADPQLIGIMGDILIGNMDIPGAQEISKRLKKLLPPQLQDGDQGGQVQQIIAQHAQLAAQVNQLSQQLQQAQQIIATKQVEKQADIQKQQLIEASRQSITKMQEATKLAVAQINASKDANQSFAENEINQFEIMHDAAHDLAMQQAQQEHEKAMAQLAAQQAAQQQQSDQGHELGMAAFNQASGPQGAGEE